MNINVLLAVFKRNFVAYFANPTGYVFICVFVLLSALAAFWPNEFFNANLANLDQLNRIFPIVMLFFIPAITMSMWAEESRQGTDELLLTIPAGDLDIVLGKYLAGVAIYSVSLLFSLVSNYIVLRCLGQPDPGLFLATHVGYWMVGLAMLAIGMVASFLTRNLTVAYIIGAALNAPLAFLVWADTIPKVNRDLALVLKQWSFGGQFTEFGRGLVRFSAIFYFVAIVAVMLYLCMVLIGRRHWVRGGSWALLGLHYGLRAAAMAVIAVAAVYALHYRDVRIDATSEQLSSLSSHTIKLLGELRENYDKAEIKRPVRIEAFISPKVPEAYVQARLNLIATLEELKARAPALIDLEINDTERASPMADLAKRRYNITPHRVDSSSHGTFSADDIFLHVVVTCGRESVPPVFVERAVPVEYELVRSLCTVTQQKRKRIGVIETDAALFGQFNMMQGGASPDWPIITELKKQYDVVKVNPAQPIPARKVAKNKDEKDEGFDVLLAVQPTAMGPQEMDNFLAAIRAGQPTVLFVDPMPVWAEVPGSSEQRRPPDQMQAMMMRQQMPKGDIRPLWRMLGVEFSGESGSEEYNPMMTDMGTVNGNASNRIVWQRYNPIRKLSELPPEFVFIDHTCTKKPFDEDSPISSKLQLLTFPMPGYIQALNKPGELKDRKFTALVRTGTNSGSILYNNLLIPTPMGRMINPAPERTPGKGTEYVLAAQITGLLPPQAEEQKDPKAEKSAPAEDAKVNVVLVADVDMLTQRFFAWREQGELAFLGIKIDFDNITLVLNALDSLAGDERFLELRKRRPLHRTLARMEDWVREDRQQTAEAIEKFRQDDEKAMKQEQETFDKKIKQLKEELKRDNGDIDQAEIDRRVEISLRDGQARLDAAKTENEEKRKKVIEGMEDQLAAKERAIQGWFKLWAVLIPPIAPLLLGVIVFFVRRAGEREGVAKSRLR